jgi:hypothetical protein
MLFPSGSTNHGILSALQQICVIYLLFIVPTFGLLAHSGAGEIHNLWTKRQQMEGNEMN